MATKWVERRLEELGTIVGGATPSTKRADYYGGDIPWITPKDLSVFQGRYISRGERNITEAGLASCSAQLMPKNAVLFTSRAPIGYVAIAAESVCTNQGFKSVVANEKTDSLFLYYLLKYNKDAIEALGTGTTFKEVSGKTMKAVKVCVPETRETQRKIAAILSALDDKIELNRRINANLSAQLETVYRGRFAADDMKRGGSLADICRYSAERVAVEELALDRYYSTENMAPEKAGAFAAATLPAVANVVKCRTGDVLVSNIRPYFKKILYCQTDCGCSPDVLCFTPQTPELSAFLFATLYADEFFEFMVAGSKGTKMPRGDKKQIMTYPVAIPTVDELNEFNKLATPLLTEIENNRLENIALAAVRDAALPRLMSGEIDVDDVKF